ncbi:MAG: signal peptidase I [Candidatus Firestonebacteria bacterium]
MTKRPKAKNKPLRNQKRSVVKRTAKKTISNLAGYGRIIIEALAVAIIIVVFLLQGFKIPSASMYPTLKVNDRLLVVKFIYGLRIPFTELRILPLLNPRQGEIIVFKFPGGSGRDYIKRCIALPGGIIQIKDKAVILNNKELKETYAGHSQKEILPAIGGIDSRDNFGPFTVPAGSYFMLGDNRDESNDSRFWGVVPEKNIVGRAIFIYWPPERIRFLW